MQIPHKTAEGRNNICGSKFAGIPLAPCKYHTKRQRVGTTFVGHNLPGSPWCPAKVLQIRHKTGKGRNNFAGQNLPGSPWRPAKDLQKPHKTAEGRNNIVGQNLPGSPWRPAKVLQIPHKTTEGRNNICGSKFAGMSILGLSSCGCAQTRQEKS